MTPCLRTILGFGLVNLLLQVPALAAEQSRQVPAPPVPAQIFAAKKVFIANAGGDERWFEKPASAAGRSAPTTSFMRR